MDKTGEKRGESIVNRLTQIFAEQKNLAVVILLISAIILGGIVRYRGSQPMNRGVS